MASLPACDVIIIGGGFSGLMVAANAVRLSPRKLTILWADESGRFARGTAYATRESHHLLNVPAGRMGAWADAPGDFSRWLAPRHPRYGAQAFVPRMIYGDYLQYIMDETATRAALHTLPFAATAARRGDGDFIVDFANGASVHAKAVILATGNPACRNPGWPDDDMFVPDFWRWRLSGNHFKAGPEALVIIAGTGLTAADAVLSLRSDGYKGRILAVSPHGWLPLTHTPPATPPDLKNFLKELTYRPTARGTFRTVRAHAAARPTEWRALIDGIRPVAVPLWQSFSEKEKRRFLRHVASVWNIHRHRMAPEIAAQLDRDDKLEIAAGRITSALADGTVAITLRGQTRTLAFSPAKVFNCTGPSYRTLIEDNPLLKDLKRQALLTPGTLGLGVAAPQTPGLFTLGTPLIGERFETTAVPELREQAAAVAKAIHEFAKN